MSSKTYQPVYYKKMKEAGHVEPIRVIRSVLTPPQLEGFYRGNMIKYLLRAPYKGQFEQDMNKLATYGKWLREKRKSETNYEDAEEPHATKS